MRSVSANRTGLSRLGRYLSGRWLLVAGLIVIATGSAAAQAGGWLLVRVAIDDGIAKGDEHTLTVVVAIYLVVNLLGWLCQLVLIRGLARVGQGIVLGLRRDLFDHLTSLSLRYFSEQRAGWIIARVTSDVDAISDALSQGLPTLVSNVVLLPTTVIVLFVVDWRLGIVAMVILPPTLVLTRWFQRKSAVAQLEVRNRIAAVTAQVAESVSGMAIVQAFNRERQFQGQFDELNAENRTANIYAQKLFSVFFPSIELLGAVSTCAVLVVGSRLLADGTLTIGTLITAIYLLQLVFQPLQELSDVYGQLQAAAAAMVKVSSVLDAEPDIGDRPGAAALGPIAGSIDLDHVHFAYGDTKVLHDIEIHVPPGGCVALVGQTGGGKSTLAKLIARFYDPGSGAVRVDGTDLREVQLSSYRRQLGVVLQDPFLFSGTIADNVRFGRPEATDAEVRRDRERDRPRPAGRAPARWARTRGARGRRRPLGGRAAADLDRAGAARRSAHPDPRRGDVQHRPPDRGRDRARARPAPARPQLDHHRPPPRHRPPGRCCARGRARPHRPARRAGRPARRRRAVPAARERPPHGRAAGRRRRVAARPRRCLHAAADRRTIGPEFVPNAT